MIKIHADGEKCITEIEGTAEDFATELACLVQAEVITMEHAEHLIARYNEEDSSESEIKERAKETKKALYAFQTEAKK